MDDLWRQLAPISDAAWKVIDDEARNHLKVTLAARRLVDFAGPLGWAVSSVELGKTQPLEDASHFEGVSASMRRVQRMLELRAPFELSRRELDSVARGGRDVDLTPLRRAARAIGIAEDSIIFHGCPEAQIQGMFEAARDSTVPFSKDFRTFPVTLSKALSKLLSNGVAGPYALALSPECYEGLAGTTTEGGYPVLQHAQKLVNGSVFSAPGVQGALLCSLRGGDFELSVGRDLSIGYHDHSASGVRLYIEESMTFRVLSPEACVPLTLS